VYFVDKVPYDLDGLWNKMKSVIYACPEDSRRRESDNIEDHACFLIKWAEEMYGEWAPWIQSLLPHCKTSYVSNSIIIVDHIKELYHD